MESLVLTRAAGVQCRVWWCTSGCAGCKGCVFNTRSRIPVMRSKPRSSALNTVNASCFWVVQFASGSASTKLLPGPPLGTLAYSKLQSGKGLIGYAIDSIAIVSHSVCIRSGISLWQNIIASISEDFP